LRGETERLRGEKVGGGSWASTEVEKKKQKSRRNIERETWERRKNQINGNT